MDLPRTAPRDRFLMVGVPSAGLVSLEWHVSQMQLVRPVNRAVEYRYVKGKEVGEARNELVRWCLEFESDLGERFSHLFFVDDDTLVPPYGLVNLLALERPMVSGLSYLKTEAPQPMLWTEPRVGPLVDFRPGDIIEDVYHGAGCLLVHRSVFEALEPPWFQTSYTEDGPETEDMYFLSKAKAAGIQTAVDTSVVCWHFCPKRQVGFPAAQWKRGDPWPILTKDVTHGQPVSV